MQPQSIAVVGASDAVGKVGHTVIKNILDAAFPGQIYVVNFRRETVMGRQAFPSVSSLPEVPELVLIVTPAPSVPSIVRQCADIGVPAVLILSAGFREAGAEGLTLEQEVLDAAHSNGTRVVGPNCLGIISPRGHLNATFAASMALPGNVAFLSQSGALCTAVLDWSLGEKVGFSALVSLGSMLDVGWADMIRYFGNDPGTDCILIYMETVGEARSFVTAAREIALKKPIVVIKAGRSEDAMRAAVSHTGSMTGSDAVLDAAFRRCGVLRVKSVADLFYMAEVLGKQPTPEGPRLTIVTNAGGPGVLATDTLIEHSGVLAQLTSSTIDDLNTLLPPHWSHGNPIDVLGDASAERYAKAVEIALKDPNTDGVLSILTPQGMTLPAEVARAISPLAHSGKPILACFMGGQGIAEGADILHSHRIPSFPYPDSAARVFDYLWQYSRNLKSLYETPVLDEEGLGPVSPAVTEIIKQALQSERTILSEAESKDILSAYKIPVVATTVAIDEETAVRAAEQIGFPVVLKLNSRTITHKTDVGGVVLNILSSIAVKDAFQAIRRSVEEKVGRGHFEGVTVQRMLLSRGCELILGSSVDAQFGPVLLFGLGGELVELFEDRALALPPLNTVLARRLFEQTKVYSALRGVRGRNAVDLALLERILVRFSRLVVDHPRIREIDINPLFASDREICAIDARIILYPASVTDAQLPRPAIRPYPQQYSSQWITRTGDRLVIRPIRPEDEPKLVLFHKTLSDDTVHMRYFAGISYEQRTAHERLTRSCAIDYNLEMALVAEIAEGSDKGNVVGVGRLVRCIDSDRGEFAVVVSDGFQRRGLGCELLRRLVEVARDENLEAIEGWVAPSNVRMQNLCRKLGFDITLNRDEDLTHAVLVLA